MTSVSLAAEILPLIDAHIAEAPLVRVYCTVKDCPVHEDIEPEQVDLARAFLRIHVAKAHRDLILRTEPGTIEP